LTKIYKIIEKWFPFLLDKRARYVAVGGFNTVFGYSVTVGLYSLLTPRFHIGAISILANFLGITVSFVTYKLFVFRTSGRWLHEYFRSYLVYGSAAVVSTGSLWFLVNVLGLVIWLAQGMVVILIVTMSYIGHNFFTFRRAK